MSGKVACWLGPSLAHAAICWVEWRMPCLGWEWGSDRCRNIGGTSRSGWPCQSGGCVTNITLWGWDWDERKVETELRGRLGLSWEEGWDELRGRLRLSRDGTAFLSVRMSWVKQRLPLGLKLRFRVRLTEAKPARHSWGGQPPRIYDQSMTNATHDHSRSFTWRLAEPGDVNKKQTCEPPSRLGAAFEPGNLGWMMNATSAAESLPRHRLSELDDQCLRTRQGEAGRKEIIKQYKINKQK